MSMRTAPYNDSMRIGSGFNSYTQQLCVNDAVIKDNQSTVSEKDLRPKLPVPTGDSKSKVSQQVTFTSKFVESASEITDALNISGSLAIKYNGIGVDGGGSYVDSSKVNQNDINFFVQVKVVNQQVVADDATQFNAIPNMSVKAQKRFTEVYGDSFISGFLEGGEFNALLSVKVHDKAKVNEMKGNLSLSLEKAGFGISGKAQGGMEKSELLRNAETSITVSWTGGGEMQPHIEQETTPKTELDGADNTMTIANDGPPKAGEDGKQPDTRKQPGSINNSNTPVQAGWTIETMAKAAFSFADKVATCPQRTHAILTKYTALRSFQVLTNKGTPLDYENAGVYTNALLEYYMEYKKIWTEILTMAQEVSDGTKKLAARSNAQETAEGIRSMKEEYATLLNDANQASQKNNGAPTLTKDSFPHIPEAQYEPNLFSLEKARLHCRLQMIRIVQEVDAVAEDPQVAIDPCRVGRFLNPLIFRQLLPGTEARPTEQELISFQKRITELEGTLASGLKDSREQLAAFETKCTALQTRIDEAPPAAEEVTKIQKQLDDLKRDLKDSNTSARLDELQKQLTDVKNKPQDDSGTTGILNNLQTQLNAISEKLKEGSPNQALTKLQGQQEQLQKDVKVFKATPWRLYYLKIGELFISQDPKMCTSTPSKDCLWEIQPAKSAGLHTIRNVRTGDFMHAFNIINSSGNFMDFRKKRTTPMSTLDFIIKHDEQAPMAYNIRSGFLKIAIGFNEDSKEIAGRKDKDSLAGHTVEKIIFSWTIIPAKEIL